MNQKRTIALHPKSEKQVDFFAWMHFLLCDTDNDRSLFLVRKNAWRVKEEIKGILGGVVW